jgi:ribonuclease T
MDDASASIPVPAPVSRPMAERFRGYLPVVVDVETGGFDWNRHALLELAAIPLEIDDAGRLVPGEVACAHFEPAPGTEIDPKSLEVTGIVLDHPFRMAKPEREALDHVFAAVRAAVKRHNCQRAILVGHNAHFDLNFLNAAVARVQHKRNPFHPFSVFDTVSLAGVAYGQTVLARAVQAAGFTWKSEEAHSAVYDAERTAELFCRIATAWQPLSSRPMAGCLTPTMGRLYADASFRPMMPATISARLTIRPAFAGSPSSTTPRIAVPTAPTPTHTA